MYQITEWNSNLNFRQKKNVQPKKVNIEKKIIE